MQTKPLFGRAVIVGVGLIGGSIARVLKNRGIAGKVIGAGRGKENLATALQLGIVDETGTPEEAAEKADLIILCTPVLSIVPTLEKMAPHIKGGALVTDAGSTKKEIVSAAEKIAAGRFTFVGSHPIAGTEKSGAASSFETLFENHKCIVTPTATTPADAVERVKMIWEMAGMRVMEMPPAMHDNILGAVSHLPHLVVYALVNAVSEMEGGENLLKFAAGGFRDFTRIASSPAEMWADIALANGPAMMEMIGRVEQKLSEIEVAIENNDREALLSLFGKAAAFRAKLPSGGDGGT
ncbi:MAG: prephenate dehydrogenase/arogenate dehydrogenase family protein [Nitrospinae bacterium]|nr:prephenate dehydrogenase/arogenate dehydrogenase family protein [Nitrospinota bacterium]